MEFLMKRRVHLKLALSLSLSLGNRMLPNRDGASIRNAISLAESPLVNYTASVIYFPNIAAVTFPNYLRLPSIYFHKMKNNVAVNFISHVVLNQPFAQQPSSSKR